MEWGTEVRGIYEIVCPPELIVMRRDFEDDIVPVPGGEMTGYRRRVEPGRIDTPPRPASQAPQHRVSHDSVVTVRQPTQPGGVKSP